VQHIEALQVFRPRLERRLKSDAAFQHGHDRENLVEVVQRQLGDEAAAPRLDVHQALGGEDLQRLAQRRAADAEVGGERRLVQALPRNEVVAEDALAQEIDRLLAQGRLVDH
jgi:hypothetical protein